MGMQDSSSVDEHLITDMAICIIAAWLLAVGAQLAPDVDIDQAVAQWNRHSTEFFVKYRTLYSTHPQTLCRLDELGKAARELGIR